MATDKHWQIRQLCSSHIGSQPGETSAAVGWEEKAVRHLSSESVEASAARDPSLRCRLLINRLTEKKQFVGWPAPDQWATWSAGIGQVMTLLRVKGAAVENTVMAEIEWSVLCQGLARFTVLQSGKLDHFSSPPSGGRCLACIPATSFPSTLAAT